jgi:predicted unusual protein kinase regulating ubiquinone biosynthesis (AarF/ABC1/UbiB family)
MPESSLVTDASYEPPRPIVLPRPSFSFRWRRRLHTAGTFGRRLAVESGRDILGRKAPVGGVARGVRLAFEDLGATYVKFGQLVASAPALIPEALTEEFRSTLDSGPPIPYQHVRRIVERELGAPIEELYASFEEEPFAAASIAAVHRATLRDGRSVAVKVIRPGVASVVAADMDLMQPIARALAWQGVEAAYNGVSYLIGLREQVAEELDLRNEARTMEYFRGLFATFELTRLAIPEVIASHSSRRMLTMEFIDGVPVDDLSGAAEMGVDPAPLVNDLLRAWVLTALRAGIFHADIHAGNLLLMPDGRLAMLDWGVVARLDPETRQFFRALVRATLGEEAAWDDIVTHTLATQGPLIEAMGYSHEQVMEISKAYLEPVLMRPLKDVSMAAMFMSPEKVLEVNHGVAAPKRSLREKWAQNRLRARTYRMSFEAEVLNQAAQRANFLSAKQLLYLERYGRMYMPEERLLGDPEFLRAALTSPPDPLSTRVERGS